MEGCDHSLLYFVGLVQNDVMSGTITQIGKSSPKLTVETKLFKIFLRQNKALLTRFYF